MLLFVSSIVFFLGLSGIYRNRKNLLVVLMCIELMLLGINLGFLTFAVHIDDRLGGLFCLLILTVAAAESSIGLALLVIYYRVRGNIALDSINLLKG